jgi:hypothetical protein
VKVVTQSGDVHRNDLSWPHAAAPLCFAVAIPLAIFQLSDSLMTLLVNIEHDEARGRLLETVQWSGLPLFGLYAYLLSRLGWHGAYMALFGLVLSLIVAQEFRGGFIRFGTFDLWEDSKSSWLGPILTGTLAGTATGVVRSYRLPCRLAFRSTWWLAALPMLTFLAGLESWRLSVGNPAVTWSSFAPTRHIALIVIGLSLSGVGFCGWRAQGGTP